MVRSPISVNFLFVLNYELKSENVGVTWGGGATRELPLTPTYTSRLTVLVQLVSFLALPVSATRGF